MWHVIWMTAVWFQDQANTKLSLPVTTFPQKLLPCTDFSNSLLAIVPAFPLNVSKQLQNKLCTD
jgi:hypothetical protein